MSWRHVWSRSVTCNFTTVIYMRARLQINTKPSMGLLNTTRSRQSPRRNDIKGSIWPTSERGEKGILDRVFRVLTPSLFSHPKWRSQKVWVLLLRLRAHGLVCFCHLIEVNLQVSNAMTTNYTEELDFRLMFGESSYPASLDHAGLYDTFTARDDYNQWSACKRARLTWKR